MQSAVSADILSALGQELGEMKHPSLVRAAKEAGIRNNWFTADNVRTALRNLGAMLERKRLEQWFGRYPDQPPSRPRTIALVPAGNIPLACFHDLLCILVSGHRALVRLSSDDNLLLPAVTVMLRELDPGTADKIIFCEGKLENFDAVIATGSNNTARYFEYYFSKYPHIIRKNRNAAAVLGGNESREELGLLAADIFTYFGLGCRNVSELFVPDAYDFAAFFEAAYAWKDVILNKKYGNNYDYNRAILLMNKVHLLDNNFLLLKQDRSLQSPVSVLHYEYYSSLEQVKHRLDDEKENLQCVVSSLPLPGVIPFGSTQSPMPWDYPDGVDVMAFLLSL